MRTLDRLFGEWLESPPHIDSGRARDDGIDLVVGVPGATFLVSVANNAHAPTVRRAAERLTARARRGSVLLLAVPFMGDVGRRICAELQLSWVDLSGNADIRAPRLRILVEGRPNRYVRLGRPATPFAPKSSRLARHLLVHPARWFTQRELAAETELDPSQVSRLVARLKAQRLVKHDDAGHIALADRRLMLEAWSGDYDFGRHDVIPGHIPGRSGEDVMRRLAKSLAVRSIPHAFTGLAAAWALTRFASFRLVTLYVDAIPDSSTLASLDFHEDAKGANVWFVRPNDPGVRHAARAVDGITCVHPVQAYLDLKAQPERSADAAAHLLEQILRGELDG